uniref:Putative secreted protein n=1 Tax=Haematobia irritans TaxID=7368 RepID=A0A1L8EJ99_HAEIR
MIGKMQILYIGILLIIGSHITWAKCNVCLTETQMTCVSKTEFRVCSNNLPLGPVNTCPEGFICSTVTPVICRPSGQGFESTCGECNKCNHDLTFACTGVKTYALCLGQNKPSAIATGTCGEGFVCNIDSPQLCVNMTGGIRSTCPLDNEITTERTTSTTTVPTQIQLDTKDQHETPTADPSEAFALSTCESVKMNTRIPLPPDMNMDCRNYIQCFVDNFGKWFGKILSCPYGRYFNPITQSCGFIRPLECSVQQLSNYFKKFSIVGIQKLVFELETSKNNSNNYNIF